MKKFLRHKMVRHTAWFVMLAMTIQMLPVSALAAPATADRTTDQTAKQPDARKLTESEMSGIYGSGSYRRRYLCGTMPWHRSLRDVNVCTGNLFKSFTDIQIAPARGAGLVLQRTYNSNDDRIGPFGIGWTHAYEIRCEEAYQVDPTAQNLNIADKTDFFGGKHRFKRDADGLYTPPPYLHSKLCSDYMNVITTGYAEINADTEEGMDGTVKHYFRGGNERICDSIQDRFGQMTRLFYFIPSGYSRNLLEYVQDPTNRTLDFYWIYCSATPSQPWRIAQVVAQDQGGTAIQTVTYEYNAQGNLAEVHLDPKWQYEDTDNDHVVSSGDLALVNSTGLNRTTVFEYTTYDDESGLLSAVYNAGDDNGTSSDWLLVVAYQYDVLSWYSGWSLDGTLWVKEIREPGVVHNGAMVFRDWVLTWEGYTDQGGDTVVLVQASTEVIYPGDSTHPTVPLEILFGSVDSDDPLFKFYQPTCRHGAAYYRIYDGARNVIAAAGGNSDPVCADAVTAGPGVAWDNVVWQCNDYGPHGHVLKIAYAGFKGYEENSYFCEDKYFQKEWSDDTFGRRTTFDVGSKDGGVYERGNVLSVIDYTGREYDYGYESQGSGRKTSELAPVKNDKRVLTKYIYGDYWGNLTQVIQDATPTQPCENCTYLNRTTTMQYDVAGRVTDRWDPAGNRTHLVYDALGQPDTAEFYPAGSGTAQETVSYAYDEYGRMESVTSNNSGIIVSTTVGYDSGTARVSTVTEVVNEGGRNRTSTITYQYNTAGELVRKVLPGNIAWHYEYDEREALPKDDPNALCRNLYQIIHCTVGVPDDPRAIVQYDYDWCGVMYQAKVYPDADDNTRYYKTDYRYDTGGLSTNNYTWMEQVWGRSHMWLTSMETRWFDGSQQQGVQIRKDAYTYVDYAGADPARIGAKIGLRHTRAIYANDIQTPERTETYEYDDLYRLDYVNYGDNHTQDYTFDPLGNRETKVDTINGVPTTETYQYNAANMLTSHNGQTYVNDDNGNTLSGGGRTNTWDCENRLTQCVYGANTSDYIYGPDGLRRRSAVDNGTTTTYTDYVLDGQSVVQEGHLNGGGFVVDAAYLTGPRGPECRIDMTGENPAYTWYLFDGLGSVVGELDANGNVTVSRSLDVYGLLRFEQGTSTSKHKFVGNLGHMTEPETGPTGAGLTYMRARWMDPAIGRFVSQDPAKDGQNWYAYCNSDPVNLSDTSGLTTIPETGIVAEGGAIIEGGGGALSAYSQLVGRIYQIMANRIAQDIAGIVGAEHVVMHVWDSASTQYGFMVHGQYLFRLDVSWGSHGPPHLNVQFLEKEGHRIAIEAYEEFLAIVDLVNASMGK